MLDNFTGCILDDSGIWLKGVSECAYRLGSLICVVFVVVVLITSERTNFVYIGRNVRSC